MKSSAPFRGESRTAVRNGLAGFTLMELTIVIVIMAVFATLVIPSVARTSKGKGLDGAAKKLCEMLNFARASAASRKRPVTMNIAPERKRCWVSTQPVALPWLDAAESPKTMTLAGMEWPEDIEIAIAPLGENATVRSGEWETIPFRGNGRADDLVITLTNKDGRSLEIEMIASAGAARIREEP